jgi:hypothetical protein
LGKLEVQAGETPNVLTEEANISDGHNEGNTLRKYLEVQEK